MTSVSPRPPSRPKDRAHPEGPAGEGHVGRPGRQWRWDCSPRGPMLRRAGGFGPSTANQKAFLLHLPDTCYAVSLGVSEWSTGPLCLGVLMHCVLSAKRSAFLSKLDEQKKESSRSEPRFSTLRTA